ncbi:LCP family protein [Patescibacteria group bacterium]|nr:LCP family protein [Patescibacteria group bacterium]MBU1931105.1 LCP family protein [Patescibacteria group bacterium]
MVFKDQEKLFFKIRRRLYKHLFLTRLVVWVVIFSLAIGLGWVVLPRVFKSAKIAYAKYNWVLSVFSSEFGYLSSYQNRTNILILGAGGTNHTASDLTDTLIVVSLGLKNQDIALLSLPRDLWVSSLQAKLNSAYHYGEAKQAGGGLVLAKASVNELIKQPIHYVLFIDFSGFEKMIDLLGGLEIEVDQAFDDYKFPIPGKENDLCDHDPEYRCRYQALHFDAGWQHMDGITALKYVRSRNAEGEEGTDFARARRQQKVLVALQKKVLDSKLLFSDKRRKLIELFKQIIKTDIPQETYFNFFKFAWLSRKQTPRSAILDGELLYNPPAKIQGQWVLLPKENDWQKIYDFIEGFFYQNN